MKLSNLLIIVFFLLFSTRLLSNGIGIVDGSAGIYLTVLESDIEVEVNNQIATITSTQVFKNNTGGTVTFKYGFPLNENANPISLRWFSGGVWNEAEVSASSQDNEIPGTGEGGGGNVNLELVNYLGDTPLFFPPNDTLENDSIIIFELRYVELLPYFLGKVNFFFKNDLSQLQGDLLDRQSFSFVLNSEREIVSVDLLDIESTDIINPNSATINYTVHEVVADIDYNLEYELSSDGLGILPLSTFIPDSLFTCDSLGRGYVSLIIEPESNVDTEIIEKNFTLIIDRSGSMSGNKIVQARDATSFIINNLNVGDNFNIIDFSSDVSSLFENHVPYNIENQNTALAYVDAILAGGSTNISEALSIAISQFQAVDTTKANIIIFFTDGQATAGITNTPGILEEVESQVNQTETGIFLFTFGIGESTNETLLTLLAQQNNGLVNFVEDENLEEEITRFFLSVNNPVLINTSISFEPDIVHDIFPFPYPNLYKGQQLILSGRYIQAEAVSVHIEGQAFNLPVFYDFQINLSDTNDISKSILPKIWAKQKIDALTLDNYLANTTQETDSIQAEIDSVSTCYDVVSVEFTSFDDGTTTELDYDITSESRFDVNVSPTLFSSFIDIRIKSFASANEDINIEIIDVQGKLLSTTIGNINGYESLFHIDQLGELSAGIYFCKIRIGEEVKMLKIIKI